MVGTGAIMVNLERSRAFVAPPSHTRFAVFPVVCWAGDIVATLQCVAVAVDVAGYVAWRHRRCGRWRELTAFVLRRRRLLGR